VNKKSLFIINGLGLGNSTRCDAIISELQEKHFSVDILTSGASKQYFKNWTRGNLYHQSRLSYGNGGFNLFKTIFQNLKNIFLNFKIQSQLISMQYDIVVSDSDYVIFLIRLFKKFTLISINNSAYIIDHLNLLSKEEKLSVETHLLVEKMDCLLNRWIPDIVIIPKLSFEKVSRKNNQYFTSHISRSLTTSDNLISQDKKSKIALVLTGAIDFDQNDIVNKVRSLKIDCDFFVPSAKGETEYQIDFSKYDFMISNSGFSMISESISYCVPMFLLPIDKHAEQLLNAKIYTQNKFGCYSSLDNFDLNYKIFLSKLDEYKSKLRRHHDSSLRGAKQIAKIIMDIN